MDHRECLAAPAMSAPPSPFGAADRSFLIPRRQGQVDLPRIRASFRTLKPSNQRGCRLLLGILSLVLLAPPSKAQTTYTAIQDVSSFGWLDQYSLNTPDFSFIGHNACVPTSSVNVMTYLQKAAPDYFGTDLTGLMYADWIDADTTLSAPGYMNTSPDSGTAYNRLHFGLNKYVVQDLGFTEVQFSGMIPESVWSATPPPEPRPATIADSLPTWQYLYDSLTSGSGTVLGLTYTSLTAGHAISLGGFDWTDLNGDGRIDFDENAQLHFVDPLDPTRGTDPIGGAKFTTGRIWEVEIPDPTNSAVVYNTLELAYEQYHGTDLWGGALGGSTSYGPASAYLTTAVAMTVPEPSTYALLGLGGVAVIMFLRRKKTA